MKNSSLLARNILLVSVFAAFIAACSQSSPTPTSPTATNSPAPTPTTPPFPPTFVEIVRLGVGRRGPPAISPSGDRIAIPTAIGILIYSADSWDLLALLEIPEEMSSHVAWSPNEDILASAGILGNIYIWNTDSYELENKFPSNFDDQHGVVMMTLSWSPDGSKLAANSLYDLGQVWETLNWEPVFEFSGIIGEYSYPDIVWSEDSSSIPGYGYHHNVISVYEYPGRAVLSTINTGLSFASDITILIPIGLSPDATMLVYVDDSEAFHLWNIQDDLEVKIIAALSDDAVANFSWSPDSSKIAASYSDNSISILDVQTGEIIDRFDEYSSSIKGIKWFPEGQKLLIYGKEGPFMIWESGSVSELPLLLGHPNYVLETKWSPDDTELGTLPHIGMGIRWDIARGEIIQSFKVPPYASFNWSPDSSHYVIWDYPIYELWNYSNGELVSLIGRDYEWSQDGSVVSWLDEEENLIYLALESYETKIIPNGPYDEIMALSSDGSKLALVKDNNLHIVDLSSTQSSSIMPIDPDVIRDVIWSPDGNLLAIYSYDYLRSASMPSVDILIRDVQGGSPDVQLDNQSLVRGESWSPEESLFVTKSSDNHIIFWDTSTWQTVHSISSNDATVGPLAWSRDGKLFAIVDEEDDLAIWDTSTWLLVQIIANDSGGVSSFAWSHDGSMIAMGGWDGVVRIWGIQED